MQRAFRYRFYPTPEQESLLRRTIGCCRLAYNKALAARTEGYYQRGERISYAQTDRMLTGWKKDESLHFLNEVSSVPLQQALRHLQTAFGSFWDKRTGYPTFKKKRGGGSATYTRSAFRFRDGQVFLAKCSEALPIRWSRQLPAGAEPSSVVVSLHPSGRWHLSLKVDDPTIQPLPPVERSIGLDVGISALVTDSDGNTIANPRTINRFQQRMRRAQKALSRKVKGSSNRRKAKVRVARIHARIADIRQNHLHQLSTRLIRENQTIVVEDLNIRGMVKNHSLARAISDASWSELMRQLSYKAEWYGRKLVKVDRFFPSSKTCSSCGHLLNKLPLSVRSWECPSCGATHDRDHNAARNILAAGLAVEVCGASVRPSRQKAGRQER
jgi:putative transposase